MLRSTVRATALEGWELFLIDRADADGVLRPCEREPGAISLREFVRYSEHVVERSRNIEIPWRVGLNYDIGSFGPLGRAINRAGKVGTALRRLVDHFPLLQDCTDIRLDREDGMASINYRILDPDIWPRHHDAMFSLGIVGQIIRRGTGGVWDKVEFSFEAEQHEMRGDIAKVVGAPCSFGADMNQICFPEAMLDLALPDADAVMPAASGDFRQLGRHVVERRRSTPLVERLAQVVYRDLNHHGIEQERIAREIGMSSRTMRRRLADEGSSFQQVLDECRKRQALCEFRARPDLSIAQIALRLGYAEHSNFTRAFHRWTGMSPNAWRAGAIGTTH